MEATPDLGPLREQLESARVQAEAEGRTAFAQLYADWCGPCKELRGHLDDPRMQDAFAGTLVVRIEQDPWEGVLKRELPNGMMVISVPSFYAIELDGGFGRSISGGAWGPYVPEEMAPPLEAFFRGSDPAEP